jgi:PKHD-type hydroxylase
MKTYNWYINVDTVEPWSWEPIFTKEECEQIILLGKELPLETATVVKDVSIVDTTIRITNVSWIPSDNKHAWIFNRCAGAIDRNNNEYFKFDLIQLESLQFGAYDTVGSYYGKHRDCHSTSGSSGHRKLSFSVQLSDPDTYEGGDLQLHYQNDPIIAKKEQGVATFFPSYMLHEVTPVTSGIRYSLVGWVLGPRFK